MMDKLPNDPVMLLSVINMKLRDQYTDLDALCEGMNVEKEFLINKFSTIDYSYDEECNQFV